MTKNRKTRGMIVTYAGRYLDYNNITEHSVNVSDIIHALPRINRFIGHSSRAYSVGEHTIYCYLMAKKKGYTLREQLLTFLHDFTEAYVGDCPAPLKRMLPKFEEIEKEIELALYKHLDIEPPTDEEYLKIKKVDLTMLMLEMRDFTLHNYEEFIDEYVYADLLHDNDFVLNRKTFSEDDLIKLLKLTFDNLITEYRKEV